VTVNRAGLLEDKHARSEDEEEASHGNPHAQPRPESVHPSSCHRNMTRRYDQDFMRRQRRPLPAPCRSWVVLATRVGCNCLFGRCKFQPSTRIIDGNAHPLRRTYEARTRHC
jgi:hypothetical protein